MIIGPRALIKVGQPHAFRKPAFSLNSFTTWVYTGAAVDFDFVNDRSFANGIIGNSTSPLTVSRASTGYAQETSPSTAELISNGDFSQGTAGWTIYLAGAGSSVSVVSGQANIVSDGSGNNGFEQAIPTVPGRLYTVIFDKISGVTLTGQARTGANGAGTLLGSANAASSPQLGTSFQFQATGSTTFITFTRTAVTGGPLIFDNVSVKEAAGWWSFGNNIARRTTQGLLVEEARTNSIRNNSMQGAVAGSPGTNPTNWTMNSQGGLTKSVVGVGTEKGVDYIDVRFVGTASSTSGTLDFEAGLIIAAVSGQVWTNSLFLSLVGGSLTNMSNFNLRIEERDNAGASLLSNIGPPFNPTSSQARYTYTATLSNASTAFLLGRLGWSMTNGAAIDFTIRIGWPQLEQGTFATSPIRTTTVAVTRAADSITTSISNVTALSLYAAGTSLGVVGSTQALVEIDDGTINNRHLLHKASTDLSARTITTVAGVGVATLAGAVWTSGVAGKIACAAADSDRAQSFNGAAVNSSVAAYTAPSLSRLAVGSAGGATPWNGYITRIALWNSRLANATLQSLTT